MDYCKYPELIRMSLDSAKNYVPLIVYILSKINKLYNKCTNCTK
jgi:hypothetical protein